jgi:tetratricopeptide (TPR) repeat protein
LSYWYPTPNSWFFTKGADTAPFRVKVNAAAGSTVISSGRETAGAFEQALSGQPFFAAGQWEMSDQKGVAVYMPRGAGAEGQKRAAELASLMTEAVTFTAGLLGKAPEVPLRLVAVRKGAGFGSGGTVLIDESVFRRSKIDALTAMNIAEAAAKFWLGNAVVVNGEGYGSISEGLSRFIATQFIESKYGKDVADVERLRQRTAYAAVSKRDAPMATVSPLDDYYYSEVSNKGAMAWRILARRVGMTEFADTLRSNMQDSNLTLAELRAAFAPQKDLLDDLFDNVTEANLMAGLPQTVGADSKVALRNTGKADVTVDVTATTVSGEQMTTSVTLKAGSFGEVTFRSPGKIDRVEIDKEKLYPQIDYSDDVAPRDSTDSDPLLAVKKLFDKQDYAAAEAAAKKRLRDHPRFDDLRVLLGRSMLALNRYTDAEREFRMVLDEKLPTARSLAWANVGLAETAARANQKDAAIKYAETAILVEGEYGAGLAARNLRRRLGTTPASDASIKAFFAGFDAAAASNRKAEVDALVMPGEVTKFAAGVSGSTEQWKTDVRHIDMIDPNTALVETDTTVKLLNRSEESGMAVYRLTKAGGGWKLSAVEMFEVR